ncbi:hypothetical protein BS47DRAFT_1395612 [Hydnum rufescens UP504]|uniref:Uncharacterized protein n=1 Tax=Hydnum rufescens UP504 TaxID=1448309 RepID=A0A9P6DR84_9AGAM|nr:hypothetical protein BS47DRAFT_1395612 [Hydnum rufescens UP504]
MARRRSRGDRPTDQGSNQESTPILLDPAGIGDVAATGSLSAGAYFTLVCPLGSSFIPVSEPVSRNNNQTTPTGPTLLVSGLLGTPWDCRIIVQGPIPHPIRSSAVYRRQRSRVDRAADTCTVKKTRHGKSDASSVLKQFSPDNEDEGAQLATPKQPPSGMPTSGWQRIDCGPSQEIPKHHLTPPPVPSTPAGSRRILPVRPPHISPRRLVPRSTTNIHPAYPSSDHVRSDPDAEQTVTETTQRSHVD